jgi:hypothetical protein
MGAKLVISAFDFVDFFLIFSRNILAHLLGHVDLGLHGFGPGELDLTGRTGPILRNSLVSGKGLVDLLDQHFIGSDAEGFEGRIDIEDKGRDSWENFRKLYKPKM